MSGCGRKMALLSSGIAKTALRPESKDSFMPEVSMTDAEFRHLSELVTLESGIKLPLVKKTMLTSRLLKRLKALGIGSFEEYIRFVKSGQGRADELFNMIDAVSTNKTDFFREPAHFDYLFSEALPSLYGAGHAAKPRIKIWSAGCSTGEEAYSIAMVAAEYAASHPFDYAVLASDISNRALTRGMRAVYGPSEVGQIPELYTKKYLMRGKASWEGFFRVVPELRAKVNFRRISLIEKNIDIGSRMDIIFCRNVVIYFDRDRQTELFMKLFDLTAPGGYLFIGHSETLDGINCDYVRIAPTIYRKEAR
ncbi:MAG: CheR family methyltransferase [Nitrospirota bacterium]